MLMIFTNPTFAHSPVRFPAVARLAITRRDSQVGSANLEMIMIMRRPIIVIMMNMKLECHSCRELKAVCSFSQFNEGQCKSNLLGYEVTSKCSSLHVASLPTMQVSILTAGTLGLRVGPALGELVLLLGRLCMWKQWLTSPLC